MYRSLEEGLGYIFEDRKLLENALTHSSYANENRERGLPDNERLEFLGDSILGFVVADYLYRRFPRKARRGAHENPCGPRLRDEPCQSGRHDSSGRFSPARPRRETTAAAESATRSSPTRWSPSLRQATWTAALRRRRESSTGSILSDIPVGRPRNYDYKTALQELVQRKKDQSLHYALIAESGPDHDKHFTVEVLLNGSSVGQGTGSSKKRAEQAAAEAAIEKLFPNEL